MQAPGTNTATTDASMGGAAPAAGNQDALDKVRFAFILQPLV
jgi:hypothetical protein